MSQSKQDGTMGKSLIEKNMIGFFSEKNNRIAAIIFAVIVGVLFTTIIIEYSLGVNVFILSLAMTVAVGCVMHKDNNLDINKYAFWSLVFLSIASVFFRLKSETYTIFAVLFMPPLFILLTIFSGKKLPSNIIVSAIVRFFGSIAFVDKIFIAVKSLLEGTDGKSKKQVFKVLIGIGISAVLLLMIVPLMFSADVVFKNFVVEFVDLTNFGEVLWKTVLSLVITILFFGFLYIITVKKDVPPAEKGVKNKKYNAESVLIVILSVVGAVYALFSIMQFSYLFGGSTTSLPDGFTLTEYARSGYFEQVFMTIINLGVIAVALFLTDNSKSRLKGAINGLLTYFIAVNAYLMVSSAYKMYLYQDMYGFTTLRLFVDILLLFEICVFVLVAVKIFKRKIKYLTYLLYFTAAFWAAVSFVNVEGMCANLNIDRYEDGEEIDIEYLSWLNDVSLQMKYIYTEHYHSLEEEQKTTIEEYFLNDARNSYAYVSGEILEESSLLEFNISEKKRASDARDVLKFINKK